MKGISTTTSWMPLRTGPSLTENIVCDAVFFYCGLGMGKSSDYFSECGSHDSQCALLYVWMFPEKIIDIP